MKRYLISTLMAVLCISGGFAKHIVIKASDSFSSPLRDGHPLFPDSLVIDDEAEELVIPDLGVFGCLNEYGNFPNLRKITFGNLDYVPGGLLRSLPALEEVVFNGMIGHFDCSLISHCPKLKKVTFKGPVSSTGGPGFLYNLPELENVTFEGVVVNSGLDLSAVDKCPKLKGITGHTAFLKAYNDMVTPVATTEQLKTDDRLIADMERIARWQSEVLRAKDSGWMRKWQYQSAKVLQPRLAEIGSPEAIILKKSMEYAWNLGDDVKNEIEILKESAPYATDTINKSTLRYADPTDSLLTLSRVRFNLDSIAGNGDDISRIKNLLYWVHNNIRHDGENGLAPGPRNLRNTYDSARKNNCGYNCRALAISLTEALLAEGIPARYITCLPKAWEKDPDCHVICVAWSESLGKWIWVDPTFAAYIMDENGLLLHPGEVRYRIQHDLPVILNADANWNNEFPESKEEYIDYYMAKNLYILSTNTLNQAEPEGESIHVQGDQIGLVPCGMEYSNSDYNTTDDEWFWQAPGI